MGYSSHGTNPLSREWSYKHIHYRTHCCKLKTKGNHQINYQHPNQSVCYSRCPRIWVEYPHGTTQRDPHKGNCPGNLMRPTISNYPRRWPHYGYKSKQGSLKICPLDTTPAIRAVIWVLHQASGTSLGMITERSKVAGYRHDKRMLYSGNSGLTRERSDESDSRQFATAASIRVRPTRIHNFTTLLCR